MQCKSGDYHDGLGSDSAEHGSIITYILHIITQCCFHLELHSVPQVDSFGGKKRIYSSGYRIFIRQQSNNPQIIFLTFSIMFMFMFSKYWKIFPSTGNILQSK